MTRIDRLELPCSILARSGASFPLTDEPSLSRTARTFWANDWFATRIRARSNKRTPPHAAPWRSLRPFDFRFMCVSIVFVLCGARNAATTPPLPVHDGRHPTPCKLLIMQVDTSLRMAAIRTLCPISRALGHSVPYSAVVTLVTQRDSPGAISEADSENSTVPE